MNVRKLLPPNLLTLDHQCDKNSLKRNHLWKHYYIIIPGITPLLSDVIIRPTSYSKSTSCCICCWTPPVRFLQIAGSCRAFPSFSHESFTEVDHWRSVIRPDSHVRDHPEGGGRGGGEVRGRRSSVKFL